LLTSIDRLIDLAEVRQRLDSSTGPSIDPELLVRMLLVGYCHGWRLKGRRVIHRERPVFCQHCDQQTPEVG
jgi:hypothetical protein